MVVGRRVKREQVGQPEEFRAVRAIKAPQQGPVVIAVVGGDLLVLVTQGFGASMGLQQLADAVASVASSSSGCQSYDRGLQRRRPASALPARDVARGVL